MDAGEDDNLIERELEIPKAKPWKAVVTTGKDKHASPKSQVVIVLYGEEGKTEEIPLGDDPENDLQSGKTEEFEVSSRFISMQYRTKRRLRHSLKVKQMKSIENNTVMEYFRSELKQFSTSSINRMVNCDLI